MQNNQMPEILIDYKHYLDEHLPVVLSYKETNFARCQRREVRCEKLWICEFEERSKTHKESLDAMEWRQLDYAEILLKTGFRSDIVAVMICHDIGRESLKMMENYHGCLPPTLSALVFTYGEIRFYKLPYTSFSTAEFLMPGFGVYGDGGAIPLPHSRNTGLSVCEWENQGQAFFDRGKISELPENWAAALQDMAEYIYARHSKRLYPPQVHGKGEYIRGLK